MVTLLQKSLKRIALDGNTQRKIEFIVHGSFTRGS